MLGCFSKGCSSVVGLEITIEGVRMVRVRRRRGRIHLQGWAVEPCLGTAAVTTYAAPANDPVAMALRRARQRVGEGRLVVSLPVSQVIVKPRRVPHGPDEDALEAWLLADADRFVPFSLDDMALDFCVAHAGPSASDDLAVWVAACRQAQLDELTGRLEIAGLKASVVEVDAVAIWRLATHLPGQRPALMHVQGRWATLYAWPAEQAPQSHVLTLDAHGGWLQAARHWLVPRSGWPGVDVLGVIGLEDRQCEALAAPLSVPCHPVDPWSGFVLEGGESGQADSETRSSLALASCLAMRGLEQ